jgi:hypothetical protein
MSIQELLQEDLKIAMKNKDLIKKQVVIMIKSDIKNLSIDLKRDLEDVEVIEIISRKVKQTRDAMVEFGKAGRIDLLAQSEDEIRILESYLPQQMNEMEIEELVATVINELTTSGLTINKGSIMKVVAPLVKGRADGKMVSKIVDQFLEGLK